MKQIRRLIIALSMLTTMPVAAQVPPYVHGATVGTSPVQVLPVDSLRKKIFLYNPNASAVLAFCPAGPNRDTGAALTCAVNGAGSITLQPYTGLVLTGSTDVTGLNMSGAWNGIASAGGSAYTILEFE